MKLISVIEINEYPIKRKVVMKTIGRQDKLASLKIPYFDDNSIPDPVVDKQSNI